MLKAAELRDKTMDELRELEDSLYKELFELRMQLITGQLTNYKLLGVKRKELARVKTIIREKELKIR